MTRQNPNRDRAETIALDALVFLAAGPERIERFLRQSGLEAATLKARAGEAETLRAVLDFLLADERLAEEFCQQNGLSPRELWAAQHLLEA